MITLTEFLFDLPQGVDLGSWAANRLRGALGKSLRTIACATGARTCAGCPLGHACIYRVCFETEALQDSRFHEAGQEAPRPYVIRGPILSADGGALRFQLVLVGLAAQAFPYFALAVKEWERPGMGPGRAHCKLRQVRALHPLHPARRPYHVIHDGRVMALRMPAWEVTEEDLQRAAAALPEGELGVRFVTPTRLKLRGEWVRDAPPFHALVAALLRRLEALHTYHGLPVWWIGGKREAGAVCALDVEAVRELIALSDQVQLVQWDGHSESRERYSYRQRRRMEFEGFVGHAVYRGDLRPFRPLLKLGELVHVGKGAVFGLGQIALDGR